MRVKGPRKAKASFRREIGEGKGIVARVCFLQQEERLNYKSERAGRSGIEALAYRPQHGQNKRRNLETKKKKQQGIAGGRKGGCPGRGGRVKNRRAFEGERT